MKHKALMRGYYKEQEKTIDFTDDGLKTGDEDLLTKKDF
jgi:long-subunit acyl-CoA synthetase (AMP-forming)